MGTQSTWGVSLDPHITIVTMKFLALTAVLLAAAQAKTIQLKMDAPPDHLEYGFCEGSPEPATIDVADVQPFPVIIKQGQEISLEVQVTLNEEVAVGATVDLKLVLEGLIPVKIPCLDIDGHNIGSYDAGLCPQYVPDGQECKLPLAPGVFGGGEPFVITIEDAIPDIIKPFLKGTIRAEATAKDAGGNVLACVWVRVAVDH